MSTKNSQGGYMVWDRPYRQAAHPNEPNSPVMGRLSFCEPNYSRLLRPSTLQWHRYCAQDSFIDPHVRRMREERSPSL